MNNKIQWLMEQPVKAFDIHGLRLMFEVCGNDLDELPPGIDDLYDRMSDTEPTMKQRLEALACDLGHFNEGRDLQIVRCVETMHDTARVLEA